MHIPRGQMSVFRQSRIKKCCADRETGTTAHDRVGHNGSVVYTAHGMGIFSGTSPIQWNPETQFPLCCVIHGLRSLRLILFTLPSPLLPPTSAGWRELSPGCSMSGCLLELQAATWAHQQWRHFTVYPPLADQCMFTAVRTISSSKPALMCRELK